MKGPCTAGDELISESGAAGTTEAVSWRRQCRHWGTVEAVLQVWALPPRSPLGHRMSLSGSAHPDPGVLFLLRSTDQSPLLQTWAKGRVHPSRARGQ